MRRQRLNPRDYLIFLLGRREYSEAELRTRLRRREGVTPEEIEAALVYVKEQGYQSDARYAASRARLEARRKGNRVIARKLSSQGITREQIDIELDGLAPETERAVSAVSRFEGEPFSPALKGKVWRFLVGRGFSRSAVEAAFAHLKEQDQLAQEAQAAG